MIINKQTDDKIGGGILKGEEKGKKYNVSNDTDIFAKKINIQKAV